jgi:hypothetical protein
MVAFVEGPVDLVKSQLQVNHAQYSGFLDCARKVAGSYGIRGIYQVRSVECRCCDVCEREQGLSATLMRNVPANAAYFGVYGTTRYVAPG